MTQKELDKVLGTQGITRVRFILFIHPLHCIALHCVAIPPILTSMAG